MWLTINGEQREIRSSATLQDLLKELDVRAPHYAVALNLQVVPKAQHSTTCIKEGDRIEIVHAVGGGV
ncbi:MAG: thiamine biosynthesis protein ThiS [Nitrospinae bacterium CG11_big_fil_rev_8_21_14_0_20_56_8]|nr:MAG: thiamine biosynthesis protein ThiS [Nitrospinae bacterium CG11_big_fil_rev_8_21_14_0_20_56_8]